MKPIDYITTAIVYPNSRIHVGWAWECLGADWLRRGLRGFGRETFFATGMDEHAAKVQRAAEERGLSPKEYCDQMANDIENVLRKLGISYDRFIRTSDADHERVVKALVQKAFDSGDIYSGYYEGFYCEGCEAFYTEKDLKDGLCVQHGKSPKWIKEDNYFFRLSKYQEPLLKLYLEHPDFIHPDYRRNEIINFVRAGLKDFSVSRSTFAWGIPLPFDSKHVVYVWFDALINYLTAAGLEMKLMDPNSEGARLFEARWPAKVHIIGKDISRFHCVYWPAMLMALGLPLPKQVFAHGFIHIKGSRLSKSAGNVVSPDEVIALSGPDPFRYYMLAENQFSQDGNFSIEALITKNNADLSNDFGNLVNRSINMVQKYFPGERLAVPLELTHSAEVRDSFRKLKEELELALEHLEPSTFVAVCNARSRLLNLYIDKTKPWVLAKLKTEASQRELHEVLFTLLEGVRHLATSLSPVLPFGMPEVFHQLGILSSPETGAIQALKWGEISFQVREPKPIYPRLELSEAGVPSRFTPSA